MKAEWRRPAIVGALAAAALAVAPAAALATNSHLSYSSGVVTLDGSSDPNDFHLTFTSSSGNTQIHFQDSTGAIDTAGSSVCATDGSGGVDCVADATNMLDSVVIKGNDGNDQVGTFNAPSGFPLTFYGGPGWDTLYPGPEQDTFHGGDDRDDADYVNASGPVNVSADGVANDGMAGETDNIGTDVERLEGTNYDDTLSATSSAVPGCFARCTLLYGRDGNDTLNGGSGLDYLEGDAGNDTLNGNAGDDQLLGSDGNDVLNGGAGQDFFWGEPGADAVQGGPDYDIISYYAEPYSGSADPAITVSLDDVANDGMTNQDGPGIDSAGAAADNIHSDVEEVDGSNGNDTLTGDAGFNELYGGLGNDTIDGGGGADVLAGYDGDDTFLARDNAPDLVECDAGNDTATTDDIDTVSECETNNVAKATLPVQTVQVPVPVTPKARLTRARVRLGSLKHSLKRRPFLKHGVRFTLSSDEAVSYEVELTGTYRGGHIAKAGDIVLATKALRSSGRKTSVRLRLTRRTRRTIGRKARVKLTVIAINGSGNVTTVHRTIKVR